MFLNLEKNCMCHFGCEQEYHYTTMTSHPISNAHSDWLLQNINKAHLQHSFNVSAQIGDVMSGRADEKLAIAGFNHSLNTVFDNWSRFKSSLLELESDLKIETSRTNHRLDFHSSVALQGLVRSTKLKFTSAWEALQTDYLQALTTNTLELASIFRRSVSIMKRTRTDREYMYTNLLGHLNVKTELCDRILANLTQLYNSYIDGRPMVQYNVTPGGRYDYNLLPLQVFSDFEEDIRYEYTQLSEALARYLQDVTRMRQQLEEVYEYRRSNDAQVTETTHSFVQSAKTLHQKSQDFQSYVIYAIQDSVSEKQQSFQDFSESYEKSVNHLFGTIQQTLDNFFSPQGTKLSKLAKFLELSSYVDSYALYGNVTKQNFMANLLSNDMQLLFTSTDEIQLEILVCLNNIFQAMTSYKNSLSALWDSMLSEASLGRFYYQLQSDVTAMQESTEPMQRFLDIFTHKSMLNIPRSNRTAVSLSEYVFRLNSDIPSLNRDVKLATIEANIETLKNQVNFRNVLVTNFHSLRQKFSNLRKNMKEFEETFFSDDKLRR